MTKLKDLKARLMEDAEFREEYARVDEEYALIEALVRARTAAKLTQAELARRLGTTQSAVARLEGGRVSPSFATLRRLRRSNRHTADRGPGSGRQLRKAGWWFARCLAKQGRERRHCHSFREERGGSMARALPK